MVADHADIIGHHSLLPQPEQKLNDRRFDAYDIFESGVRFKTDEFTAVWNDILSSHSTRSGRPEYRVQKCHVSVRADCELSLRRSKRRTASPRTSPSGYQPVGRPQAASRSPDRRLQQAKKHSNCRSAVGCRRKTLLYCRRPGQDV